MANHVKPTKEELDKKIQDSIDELEKDEKKETPDETPKEEKKEEEVIEEAPKDEEPKEEEPKEEKKDEEVVEEKKDEEETPDYKKKFSESSKEAIRLAKKNKTIRSAVDEASAVADPTDEEMLVEYPEWDLMSDTEKRLAKKTTKSERKLDIFNKSVLEGKTIDEWNEKVDKYVGNPKTLINFPDMEGKEDSFKEYASEQTRMNMPMNDLIGSFLYEESKKKAPLKKGKMFEKGSGGPNEKDKKKTGKVSTMEAAKIKETDYKRYRFLLQNNLIDESDIE